MPPEVLPILENLFRNTEWTKKLGRRGQIERIMSGRWLPNTPTAEVAYLTYVVRGLPIPEDMAETIYDEWLQQNDEAYMQLLLEGRGGNQGQSSDNLPLAPVPPQPISDGSDLANQRVLLRMGGGDQTLEGSDVPEVSPEIKQQAKEWVMSLVRPLIGKQPDVISSPLPFPQDGQGGGQGSGQTQSPEGQRQVDPFIRMLQVALIMRMLGGTGGAFGALAMAPILKDLFDEMMGRKKRDTGQTGQTNQTGQGNNFPAPRLDTNQRLEPLPAVDEVVAQLYNRGFTPAQIASVIPFIIREVELTPEQVEQILNNLGIQGVHTPSKPKEKETQNDKKKDDSKRKPANKREWMAV